MRREIILASAALTTLIIIYYLEQRRKAIEVVPPEARIPEIPIVKITPIYPVPDRYYYHAFVRQEIEAELLNESRYGIEVYVSGEFEVPDLKHKQYLFEQK
jgi:hypothetical protein